MCLIRDALRNNIEKILTLPDETIICPGHGPMTTVGEEKRYNPFLQEECEVPLSSRPKWRDLLLYSVREDQRK